MKHSIFSASGAERWANCPGSVVFCEGIPKTDSDASREGTAGHTLGDLCLRDGTDPLDHEGEVYNEVTISSELALAVQSYVDYVRGISGIRLTEVRVHYSELLGVGDDEAFGTTDALVVSDNVLHIIDAKFGRRFVDPKLNKQMMLYAAGALEALDVVMEADEITEVHLHIMQPRVTEKPVPYIMSRAELNIELQKLRDAAQLVVEAGFNYTPGLPEWAEKYLLPGEYQCQWCPGAAACPSLRLRAKSTTPIDEFSSINSIDALSNTTVSDNLKLVPLLEIWIEAVNADAMRRLTRGDYLPGFKLVKGREGNRKWQSDEKVIEAFGDSDMLYNPKQLCSPAQLETKLKKDPRKELIKTLVVRSPARPTMTTEDDPRPVWVEAAATEEFGVVE
jgi:hypothetical protein